MKDGTGFEGTDEYDPVGDDHTDLVQKDPRAKFLPSTADAEAYKEGKVAVEKWMAEHRTLRIVSRAPGRVASRLFNYSAWQGALTGYRITMRAREGSGQ